MALELASADFDHDHLQIYWNNKDNAWQIIRAGVYTFNNNDPSKDKFSLRIDRQRGEDPENSEIWIHAIGNKVCPLDVSDWEQMYIHSPYEEVEEMSCNEDAQCM